MLPLLAPVTGLIVSGATGIAIDAASKIIIPSTLPAVTGFAVKVGVSVVGGLAATAVAGYVTKNLESVIQTVQNIGKEEPAPEDH